MHKIHIILYKLLIISCNFAGNSSINAYTSLVKSRDSSFGTRYLDLQLSSRFTTPPPPLACVAGGFSTGSKN